MTTDQRLDRIERILILYYNAGRRERRRAREMNEKINILIDAQVENEEGFRELREQSKETDRQLRETFREIRELFWKTDERISRLEKRSKTH